MPPPPLRPLVLVKASAPAMPLVTPPAPYCVVWLAPGVVVRRVFLACPTPYLGLVCCVAVRPAPVPGGRSSAAPAPRVRSWASVQRCFGGAAPGPPPGVVRRGWHLKPGGLLAPGTAGVCGRMAAGHA